MIFTFILDQILEKFLVFRVILLLRIAKTTKVSFLSSYDSSPTTLGLATVGRISGLRVVGKGSWKDR